MRVPRNIIQEEKYTTGGEFMDEAKKIYSGPYTEINGKYYKGSKYNGVNEILTKLPSNGTNPFLGNGIIGRVLNLAKQNVVSSIFKRQLQDVSRGYSIRYFTKQISKNTNYVIKEIDENMYKSLQNNFLYQTISLKYYFESSTEEKNTGGYFLPKDLEEAEKKIPGITLFLESENRV